MSATPEPGRFSLDHLVHRVWRKLALRDVTASDNYSALDRYYLLPDPWKMASETEQARFALTDSLLARHSPAPASILELGCGEGHHSHYLARRTQQLFACDVSPRAIRRASRALPNVSFAVGDAFNLPWQPPGGRYELVVACELLYYVKDPAALIRRMSQLGHLCLVTFFAPATTLIARHLEGLTAIERGWLCWSSEVWLYVLWRPLPSPSTTPDRQ